MKLEMPTYCDVAVVTSSTLRELIELTDSRMLRVWSEEDVFDSIVESVKSEHGPDSPTRLLLENTQYQRALPEHKQLASDHLSGYYAEVGHLISDYQVYDQYVEIDQLLDINDSVNIHTANVEAYNIRSAIAEAGIDLLTDILDHDAMTKACELIIADARAASDDNPYNIAFINSQGCFDGFDGWHAESKTGDYGTKIELPWPLAYSVNCNTARIIVTVLDNLIRPMQRGVHIRCDRWPVADSK